jgi:hypothetical protein
MTFINPHNKNYIPTRNGIFDAQRDEAVHKKAQELLQTDPELRTTAASNPYAAFKDALAKADKMIPQSGKKPSASSSAGLSRGNDDAISQLTRRILAEDPECANQRDEYKAFRLALDKAVKGDTNGLATPLETPAPAAALSRDALERARKVHKGAMILMRSDPTLRDLAARNYPKAFDVAHSSADAEKAELLLVPLKTETSALKPGTREDRIYQRALTTLKTALKSRDQYDAVGAFDEAIRDAEACTPLDNPLPVF